jgi:hypothetical protein
LLIRGFDDETHNQLSKVAEKTGASVNSIVRDAVDKWLKQVTQLPKKHDLILYRDDESMLSLLKSIDKFAQEGEWFRSFCGPDSSPEVKLLDKLRWYNGTIKPYDKNKRDIGKYCGQVMADIAKKAGRRPVCCMDFILGDIATNSLEQALKIEHGYNSMRTPGLMFCPYKTETLLNAGIQDMLSFFEEHDQVFILKDSEVYKLHVTKENVHKLFLS